MEIRVKSLKFDADQKLLDYVEKKVSKLSRFSDHLDGMEVTLSLLKEPDNKNVRIQIQNPINSLRKRLISQQPEIHFL